MRTPKSDMPFLLRCSNACNLTILWCCVKHFCAPQQVTYTYDYKGIYK